MSNEEFEFLDDLSEHANLPKVLINTPKLFSNNINNQHNGKLTKSTCVPSEHQANVKFRKNGDLSLSLKVGTNKMNSLADNQNGSNKNMFKTQYKLNNGNSGTVISNKNRETKKIRLTNNSLFRSMKIINNKYSKNKF